MTPLLFFYSSICICSKVQWPPESSCVYSEMVDLYAVLTVRLIYCLHGFFLLLPWIPTPFSSTHLDDATLGCRDICKHQDSLTHKQKSAADQVHALLRLHILLLSLVSALLPCSHTPTIHLASTVPSLVSPARPASPIQTLNPLLRMLSWCWRNHPHLHQNLCPSRHYLSFQFQLKIFFLHDSLLSWTVE